MREEKMMLDLVYRETGTVCAVTWKRGEKFSGGGR
jgi:hypothetical protein